MCVCVSQQHTSGLGIFLRFLDHTNTHTHTHAHPVGLVWTCDQFAADPATHTTHKTRKRRTSILSAWFEPTIPGFDRPQTYALNRTANGSKWLLNYLQSPSWESNWFAASQEIPRISRNPKVHYRTHKRPPLVSILGQPNPVHVPTSHLMEIHPNIIHPSTPRPPQWSPSLRFPHQDPIHPPLLTHTRHVPSR